MTTTTKNDDQTLRVDGEALHDRCPDATFSSRTLRALERRLRAGAIIRYDGFGFNIHDRGQRIGICLADFDSLFCARAVTASIQSDGRNGWVHPSTTESEVAS